MAFCLWGTSGFTFARDGSAKHAARIKPASISNLEGVMAARCPRKIFAGKRNALEWVELGVGGDFRGCREFKEDVGGSYFFGQRQGDRALPPTGG
jgi:hypothetical protein